MADGTEKLNALLGYAGFTKYQSEAFKSLFSLKEATIEEISNKSNVPLPKTYGVMKELERKGFVTPLVGRPQKYKALPPEIAFLDFLKNREKELATFKKHVEDVSVAFKGSKDAAIEDIHLLRTKRGVVLNLLANHLENKVKKSYYACVAFRSSNTPLIEILRKKIKDGLNVRIVGCIPEGKEYIAQKYKNLGAKVRVLDTNVPPIRFSIFDGSHAAFTLSDVQQEYVTIWTSSRPIVKTVSDLFKHYWGKGRDF